MNRRKLLKMFCIAPALTVLKDLPPELEILKDRAKTTIDPNQRVLFKISGISLIGVLNRSGARLNRLKHLS